PLSANLPCLSTSTSSSANTATTNVATSISAVEEESGDSFLNANSLRPKGHTKSASVSGRSCSSAYAPELRPIDSNSTLNEVVRPRFESLHATITSPIDVGNFLQSFEFCNSELELLPPVLSMH